MLRWEESRYTSEEVKHHQMLMLYILIFPCQIITKGKKKKKAVNSF